LSYGNVPLRKVLRAISKDIYSSHRDCNYYDSTLTIRLPVQHLQILD
jgi:hypothetical protein